MPVTQPLRVLVVCTGNICRSPLAERLLRARLGDRVVVTSAGTHGLDAAPMEPNAADELTRWGGDPDGFASHRIVPADVEDADLVLTMTTGHRAAVLAEHPGAMARTFTLLEFAHLLDLQGGSFRGTDSVRDLARRRGVSTLEGYDVADPFGQSPAVHAQAAASIADAVERIARGFAPDPTAPGPAKA